MGALRKKKWRDESQVSQKLGGLRVSGAAYGHTHGAAGKEFLRFPKQKRKKAGDVDGADFEGVKDRKGKGNARIESR